MLITRCLLQNVAKWPGYGNTAWQGVSCLVNNIVICMNDAGNYNIKLCFVYSGYNLGYFYAFLDFFI